MLRTTTPAIDETLLNKFKYLQANERLTGSSTSSTTPSFFFPDPCLNTTDPDPISLPKDNLIDSLLVSIRTELYQNYLFH